MKMISIGIWLVIIAIFLIPNMYGNYLVHEANDKGCFALIQLIMSEREGWMGIHVHGVAHYMTNCVIPSLR